MVDSYSRGDQSGPGTRSRDAGSERYYAPAHGDRPPAARRRHRLRRALAIIGSVLLALVLAAGGTVAYLAHHYNQNIQRIPNALPLPGTKNHHASPPPSTPTGPMNILLLGSDSRSRKPTTGTAATGNGGSQRSDTILVVHLARGRRAASVISIPRDSWVAIPGYGHNRVNAAFAFGGPQLLIRTVQNLTGIHIDHYMEVDFTGFRSVIDAVGGVTVYVPRYEHDPATHATFHKGWNHLTGVRALDYVRQRHDLPHGDFDRIKNQHQVLRALMEKVTREGITNKPIETARLIDAVTRSISVDSTLDSAKLRSLAWSVRHIKPSAVRFITVPVAGPAVIQGADVIELNKAEDQNLFHHVRTDTMSRWHAPPPAPIVGSNG